MTKKQRSILIGAAVCIGVAAFILPKVLSSRNSSRGAEAARESIMRVRMEIIHLDTLSDRVSTVGTLLANEEVEVRSEISGKVTAILFREGSRVVRGAPLVKINDDDLKAQLLRAESRLSIANQTAERQRQLHEKQLVSEESFTTSVNELNVAKAEVQLIQAQLEKTTLRAAFNGTIGLRNISEGSYISPATLITTLQDNDRVKVDFRVPEKYSGILRPGGMIRFRVQGNPRTFEAKIYSLDSRVDAGTRTLRMRAIGSNPGGILMPGSLASVETAVQRRQALTIPSYALIPELKGHNVFLARGGIAVSQPVQIGVRTEERVEIVSGVSQGDSLITSGILQIKPGTPVLPSIDEKESGKQ